MLIVVSISTAFGQTVEKIVAQIAETNEVQHSMLVFHGQ